MKSAFAWYYNRSSDAATMPNTRNETQMKNTKKKINQRAEPTETDTK